MKYNNKLIIAACLTLLMTACGTVSTPKLAHADLAPLSNARVITEAIIEENRGSANTFVHLFEWRWVDIATECEDFLGPNGYAAVQISPPEEHVPGPQWYTRYQPVSYKLESRGGSRAELSDMVKRCKAAGVDVYADAVINHMARIGDGSGVAGSVYTLYNYPIPYAYDDFHHCGRYNDDGIRNYQDLWEVQNCELLKLADLDTGKAEVQAKIASYLNDLLSLGIAGFRLDAAKHISHEEISEILALLDSQAFIFQEVIDRGGEPISGIPYLANGSVTEFKYPMAMFTAFSSADLVGLDELSSRTGFLPSDKAVVFVDNHDIQRGHAGAENILTYKSGKRYDLANVFMLAWPYGYPKVMSSYQFENSSEGPPDSKPVVAGICSEGWVCEHRRPAMVGMVGFRKTTVGMPVTNWQGFSAELISFSRGDRGHVVINASAETRTEAFTTSLMPGKYCNVVSATGMDCEAAVYSVDKQAVLRLTLNPMSAVVLHSGRRID